MPDADRLPSLPRDRAFWGMTITQFLGSFNDNVFKQLVLLLCVDYARESQSIALALFAIPFVAFSGFAGWLSDRVSKRRIFVLSKAGEIGVMALGAAAFLIGGNNELLLLGLLFFVLFCMSTQSAFFGPAKYGILPELFRERDLPTANGLVLMTTFVAIIFGMSFGGFAKDWFEGRLYVVSLICVGIGVVGTIAAFLVRITPIAHPGLPFEKSALVMVPKTRQMLRDDKPLLRVLIISSLFWFVGGVVQPAVNGFGKDQMHFGDSRTSIAAAFLGIGIAIGCILAGRLSKGSVNFRLSIFGAWGCAAALVAVTVIGMQYQPPLLGMQLSTQDDDLVITQVEADSPASAAGLKANDAIVLLYGDDADKKVHKIQTLSSFQTALVDSKAGDPVRMQIVRDGKPRDIVLLLREKESLAELMPVRIKGELPVRVALLVLGIAAGLFVVPLQVFLQSRPPADQKGRMIGAMNLFNWLGIVLAAVFYFAAEAVCSLLSIRQNWIFAMLALVMAIVAAAYLPRVEVKRGVDNNA